MAKEKDAFHNGRFGVIAVIAVIAVVALVLLVLQKGTIAGQYKYETQSKPGAPWSGYAREPGVYTPSEYYAKQQGRGPAKPQPGQTAEEYCATLYEGNAFYTDCLREVGQLQDETWWGRAPSGPSSALAITGVQVTERCIAYCGVDLRACAGSCQSQGDLRACLQASCVSAHQTCVAAC